MVVFQSPLAAFLQYNIEIGSASFFHPCLIQPSVLKLLSDFVKEVPSGPQFLILSGPVKSGKSTLLLQLIPGLIAAKFRSSEMAPEPHPVYLIYMFVGSNPATAAVSLCAYLYACVQTLNLTHFVQPVQLNALAELGVMLSALADAIRRFGGRLWLLLDEFQVCYVACLHQCIVIISIS
jgi:hypothetical protein